jgi:hypothetical protein
MMPLLLQLMLNQPMSSLMMNRMLGLPVFAMLFSQLFVVDASPHLVTRGNAAE